MFSSETEQDLVDCPYNKSHRILRKRLQIHLLRCRKNHTDAELQKCPFNAIHLIPEPEYMHHVSTCADRKLLTQYKFNTDEKPVEHEFVLHEKVTDEENWDEMEINVPDFKPKDKRVVKEEVVCIRKRNPLEAKSRRKVRLPREVRSVGRVRSPRRERSPYRVRSHRSECSPRRKCSHFRSRSPLERNGFIQLEKEHVPFRRENVAPNFKHIWPKRLEDRPINRYRRCSYSDHREDLPSASSQYRNNFRRVRFKREHAQSVNHHDLDDDSYYNDGQKK